MKKRTLIQYLFILALISCQPSQHALQAPAIADSSTQTSRFSATITFGVTGPLDGITENGVSFGLNGILQDVPGSLDKDNNLCTTHLEGLSAGTEYSYKCFIGNGRNRIYSEQKTFATKSYGDKDSRSYDIISLSEAGTLDNALAAAGLNALAVINLKVSGPVNDRDFAYMNEVMSALQAIDMQEAIVEGGIIPKDAFKGKKTLQHFVFPIGIEKIGYSAFKNTNLMGTLVLPEGLKVIGGFVGSGCSNCPGTFGNTLITDVEFPQSLEEIGDGAFEGCSGLAIELKLPANLKKIGKAAFKECALKGKLILPASLEKLGLMSFREAGTFTGGITIPPLVKKIPENCFTQGVFSGTLNLGNAIEFENISSAGCFNQNHFSGELIIPEGTTEIPDQCFLNNDFTSIVLPSTLTKIHNRAFEMHTKLESVTCYADYPPMAVYDNIFGDVSKCVLKVPATSIENYRKANFWKDHFLRIEAL